MGKGGQQLKHGGVHDESRVDSGAITESGVKQKKDHYWDLPNDRRRRGEIWVIQRSKER